MKDEIKAILLTNSDPWGNPRGGSATFSKYMVQSYGPTIAVVSYCSDINLPTGQWIYRYFNKKPIMFFNRGKAITQDDKKPFIPARVTSCLNALRNMAKIRSIGVNNIFIDSPELIFAVSRCDWASVCYRSAGVNNPVSNSRYVHLRCIGNAIEKRMVKALLRMKLDVILASAEEEAIDSFIKRTGNLLDRNIIYSFPTRVDNSIFYPMHVKQCRKELDLLLSNKIMAVVGRLSWIKGWDLLIDSVALLIPKGLDCKLIFVGDGEDRKKILLHVKDLGIENNVTITGFLPQAEVAKYINAADICLAGSHREGWSLAMCEMLACGKPIVSTNVSGAADMIREGQNGFIVRERNPVSYAEAIVKTLKLPEAKKYSLEIAKKYSLKYLARDLGDLWPPLRQ